MSNFMFECLLFVIWLHSFLIPSQKIAVTLLNRANLFVSCFVFLKQMNWNFIASWLVCDLPSISGWQWSKKRVETVKDRELAQATSILVLFHIVLVLSQYCFNVHEGEFWRFCLLPIFLHSLVPNDLYILMWFSNRNTPLDVQNYWLIITKLYEIVVCLENEHFPSKSN